MEFETDCINISNIKALKYNSLVVFFIFHSCWLFLCCSCFLPYIDHYGICNSCDNETFTQS